MPTEPVMITETTPDGSEADFEITTAQADDETGEASLAETIVDALFDDSSDDVASEMTAVFEDTDGDGLFDTASADTDGDGIVDTVMVDSDGDGMLDTGAADTDGDGEIDMITVDSDGDGKLDVAVIDSDGDSEFETLLADADGDGEFETEEALADDETFSLEADAGLPTEEELSSNSVEFNLGSESFSGTLSDLDPTGVAFENPPYDTGLTPQDTSYSAGEVYDPSAETFDPGTVPDESAEGGTLAEQQANAEAAREAQEDADEFVAAGDYAAAAEAREVAEDASWAAGDNSMLDGSDSAELESAGYKQELAEEYRTDQAEHIAAGDYEGGKEAAENAAYATGDADYNAGGSDHTGQSDQDAYNLGNAVYEEKNAEYFADNAEWYAEAGMTGAAESSAANAMDSQGSADTYAAQADPTNSVMYDVDHSSVVDAGGGYDMSAVDTGFDASVDTSASTIDSGMDDGTF